MGRIVKEGVFNGDTYSDAGFVNSMSDGAWIIDLQGRIIGANPALVAMLGFDDKIELINKYPGDFTSSHYQQEMFRLIHEAMAGRNGIGECALVTREGNELPVSMSANAVKDVNGNIRGYFAVIRNNTERKKSDDAMQIKLDELTKCNQQLRDSISEIKTMHGLIKICAQCKRICTDTGEWQQLEHYIMEHTDANFSHGLCKRCSDETIKSINNKRHDADNPGETQWKA